MIDIKKIIFCTYQRITNFILICINIIESQFIYMKITSKRGKNTPALQIFKINNK